MANVEGHLLAARLEIMHRAAERWRERGKTREAGLERIARKGIGAADSLKRQMEFAQRNRPTPTALGNVAMEAIVGTNDLVAFAPSEISNTVARPVARIVRVLDPRYQPQGIATGFMISSRLLLTNHHVFFCSPV